MADNPRSWQPNFHAFLRAKMLAKILVAANPNIRGVALSGSLARKEAVHHDIDLIVLHDGQQFAVGRIKRPEAARETNKFLELKLVLPRNDDIRTFDHHRDDVPVDLTLVSASVLWNCTYLHSLKPFEVFRDFYFRTFNDDNCPLYLLAHNFHGGELRGMAEDDRPVLLSANHSGREIITGIRIRHLCRNDSCKPKLQWKDCQEEARLRKARESLEAFNSLGY